MWRNSKWGKFFESDLLQCFFGMLSAWLTIQLKLGLEKGLYNWNIIVYWWNAWNWSHLMFDVLYLFDDRTDNFNLKILCYTYMCMFFWMSFSECNIKNVVFPHCIPLWKRKPFLFSKFVLEPKLFIVISFTKVKGKSNCSHLSLFT